VTQFATRQCDAAADFSYGSGSRPSPGSNRRCSRHRLGSVPANPGLGTAVVDTLNGRKPNRHLPPKNRDDLDELNSVCVEVRLTMPHTRRACLIAGTTVDERRCRTSGTNTDPGFPDRPDQFPHDATSEDGRRARPFPQQPNGPADARRWRGGDQTGVS
jgi:hypothetical protein